MAGLQEAEAAVLDAIVGLAESAARYGGDTRAAMVRDAAIAYRAIKGGAQPGSVIVEKG